MDYVVVFDAEGIPNWALPVLKQEYVSAYNKIVDIANPLIESWNDEYDRLFGAPANGNYDNPHYSHWMAQKEQHEVVDKKDWSKFLRFTVSDDLVIIGHTKIGNGTISFHIEKR